MEAYDQVQLTLAIEAQYKVCGEDARKWTTLAHQLMNNMEEFEDFLHHLGSLVGGV